MEFEFEIYDNAEVAAATAQRPEKIGILTFAGGDELTLGGHDIQGDQIVDAKPIAAA